MKRFIEGQCRTQGALLPESLDDFVSETNPVRVIDVFVDELVDGVNQHGRSNDIHLGRSDGMNVVV